MSAPDSHTHRSYSSYIIERYTVKVNPVVSQNEIIKALNEAKSLKELQHINKLKAQFEVSGDPADIERILELIKELANK